MTVDRAKLVYWSGIAVGRREDDGSITWFDNAPDEAKVAYQAVPQ